MEKAVNNLINKLEDLRNTYKAEIRALEKLVELAWEAGARHATFNGHPGVPDGPSKEEWFKKQGIEFLLQKSEPVEKGAGDDYPIIEASN